MNRKIGFYSLVAIVIGSQIGSGLFILPAALAEYGHMSLLGCLLSGVGAIFLSIVFGKLARYYTGVGGPHVYVSNVFGFKYGFFTTWSYWIISFVSTTVVVLTAFSYITPIIENSIGKSLSKEAILVLEIFLILLFMILNLLGSTTSARMEMVLSLLKTLPLVILPIGCLFYFDTTHFTNGTFPVGSFNKILSNSTLISFWGFIGLESGTTPSENVKNATTISRALVVGTTLVAIIYFGISIVVMGVIPLTALQGMDAPFMAIAQLILGGNWHIPIAIAVFIVCLGTLNAWIFVSGQIAASAAKINMLPYLFTKTNKYGSPHYSILASSLGIIPFLILTLNNSLKKQLLDLIDVSVIIFLLVYALSTCSYCKLLWDNRIARTKSNCIIGLLAMLFSIWMIVSAMSLFHLMVVGVIIASGIPSYLYMRNKSLISQEHTTTVTDISDKKSV
ncbi:APC family permease [Cardinium endosymbiont of Culicoides punctatus]|uniref:APC family permease n=1 Tax=Cardinium endosymbiont of Culicoides punctatus TaxID=2304601 RepID=UPI001404E619|nr:amino acid permease [Cardinium endosymbiont of Culicoides punctatus]